MSEQSKIQWTNFTGWIWLVCAEVSPGCAHCYARELMKRWLQQIVRKAYKAAGFADWKTRPVWGDKAPRVKTRAFEKKMLALDRKAAKEGTRYKVFPSMIDWLDGCPAGMIDQEGNSLDPIAVLAEALDVIRRCPHLDFLLLTKRPENWAERIGKVYARAIEHDSYDLRDWVWAWMSIDKETPKNVWIGTTVEDQKRADERIPHLLKIPAKVRFLSVEPMLEAIDLGLQTHNYAAMRDGPSNPHISWVIVGGESGPGSRPFNINWARSIVAQCKAAGVPVFVKQLGTRPYSVITSDAEYGGNLYLNPALKDKKGGDMSEWPEDLRVREFP